MNLLKKTQETCISVTNISGHSEARNLWWEQHHKKEAIYIQYTELIQCLENSLLVFTDSISQKKIRRQIRTLKKLRAFYKEPSILSVQFHEEQMDCLEEVSVLKMKKRKHYE